MRCLGHDQFPILVQSLVPQHYPPVFQSVIIIGMDILGCISLWYEGTVIGYGDARQRMYEVLSVRQEAVAGDTVLPAGRNGRITPVCRHVHHACWQVGKFALAQRCNAQDSGMVHTAPGNPEFRTSYRQGVCFHTGEVLAYRTFPEIL